MILFGLWEQGWTSIVAFFFVIVLAFAYHEFAHAIVADKLGDPTPRNHGRITLNPLPHLSLVGLVTLFLIGFGGAFTPINPSMLRGNKWRSHALVAVAGPLANLFMAFLFAMFTRFSAEPILSALQSSNAPEWTITLLVQFLSWGVELNLFLMVLNLLPIPPLDGFTILQGLMPPTLARELNQLRQYGMLILVMLFFILPNFLGSKFNLFGAVINPIIDFFYQLLMG